MKYNNGGRNDIMVHGLNNVLEEIKKRVRKREQKVLTSNDILTLVVNMLLAYLPIHTQGRVKLKDVYHVVVFACCKRFAVNTACNILKRICTAGNIRYHLRKLTLEYVAAKINPILQKFALAILPKGKYKFAADITKIPYHGKPHESDNEIVRGKAKHGTTHFHGYASIYLMLWGRRLTLSIVYIMKDDSLVAVLDYLQSQVRSLGYDIEYLLLDKGFYGVEVINYLKRRKIPSIMAVPYKSKSKKMRNLVRCKRSYKTVYPVETRVDGVLKTATVVMYVVRKYSKNKYGRRGVKIFLYAVYGVHIPVDNIYEVYRRRFGIESSYRMINSCRARTSSRSPAVRLLYVVVGFLIINVWVYLKWQYLSEVRRGRYGREIDDSKLPLSHLRNTIERAVGRLYGVKDTFVVTNHFWV